MAIKKKTKSKSKVRSKTTDLVKLLTSFRHEMLTRFDGVDKKFEGIDKELSVLNRAVVSLDKEVQTLSRKVDVNTAEIIEWQKKTTATLDVIAGVHDQGLRIDNVDERLVKVENEQVAIKIVIKELKEIQS